MISGKLEKKTGGNQGAAAAELKLRERISSFQEESVLVGIEPKKKMATLKQPTFQL